MSVTPLERLRARITELGWSQKELSVKLGVSEAVISRILSGEREPSLKAAVNIERATGVPAAIWVPVPTKRRAKRAA